MNRLIDWAFEMFTLSAIVAGLSFMCILAYQMWSGICLAG